MSLVDELARLEEMRARGTLSEDEFQRAKVRLIGEQATESPPSASALNRLRRSRSDKWLGGVCAGHAGSRKQEGDKRGFHAVAPLHSISDSLTDYSGRRA